MCIRDRHYTASVSNICCVKIITPCNINRQRIPVSYTHLGFSAQWQSILCDNHGQFELQLDYSAEYDERYPEDVYKRQEISLQAYSEFL